MIKIDISNLIKIGVNYHTIWRDHFGVCDFRYIMSQYQKHNSVSLYESSCFFHLMDSNHELIVVLGTFLEPGIESHEYLESHTYDMTSKLCDELCKHSQYSITVILHLYISDEFIAPMSSVKWI